MTKDMANNWFQFKEFLIEQDQSAFKVGTDGVMLGAWADVKGVRSVLDIGTGTGLLALMVAQRSNAEITAIEIDQPSFEQARINVTVSPWSERINIVHTSLQEFNTKKRFDMIISNPPFFQDSLMPVDKGRMHSRHNTQLTIDDLVRYSKPMLLPEGRLCFVFPLEEGRILKDICSEAGLHLHRQLAIRPTPQGPVKRYLMEFRTYPGSCSEDEIIIEKGERHDYTDEYRELTKEFYLAF